MQLKQSRLLVQTLWTIASDQVRDFHDCSELHQEVFACLLWINHNHQCSKTVQVGISRLSYPRSNAQYILRGTNLSCQCTPSLSNNAGIMEDIAAFILSDKDSFDLPLESAIDLDSHSNAHLGLVPYDIVFVPGCYVYKLAFIVPWLHSCTQDGDQVVHRR